MEALSDFLAELENSVCNLNLFLTIFFAKQLFGTSRNIYTVNLSLFFNKWPLDVEDNDLSHLFFKSLLFYLDRRRVVLAVLLLLPAN